MWQKNVSQMKDEVGENPLRCTTKDKKGLVFTTIFFNPIF